MKKAFSVLLVDDEAAARTDLEHMLAVHEDMEVIGRAKDGGEAVTLAQSLKPDLMFLDVQMPVLNGFEVLHHLPQPPPTIFLTAYTEFAVRAFEVAAVDYLLKPPTAERFQSALSRFRNQEHRGLNMKPLMKELGDAGFLERIRVNSGPSTTLIPTREIHWFEADSGYVSFFHEGKTHLCDLTIKKLEESLDPSCFLRIHRKVIVRLDLIRKMKRQLTGCYLITLADGREYKVSRSYVSQFRESVRDL